MNVLDKLHEVESDLGDAISTLREVDRFFTKDIKFQDERRFYAEVITAHFKHLEVALEGLYSFRQAFIDASPSCDDTEDNNCTLEGCVWHASTLIK